MCILMLFFTYSPNYLVSSSYILYAMFNFIYCDMISSDFSWYLASNFVDILFILSSYKNISYCKSIKFSAAYSFWIISFVEMIWIFYSFTIVCVNKFYSWLILFENVISIYLDFVYKVFSMMIRLSHFCLNLFNSICKE